MNGNKKLYFLVFGLLSPLFGIVLSLIPITYSLSYWRSNNVSTDYNVAKESIFSIKKGTAVKKILEQLEGIKAIHSAKLAYSYLFVTKQLNKFRSGEYRLPTGKTTLELLEYLFTTGPIVYKVSIPEGKTVKEIALLLREAAILSEESLALFLERGQELEGQLLPETYHFEKEESPEKILKIMSQALKEKLEQQNLTPPEGWTWEQILTLASIVEKETGVAEEREIIAGVFWNRLKKNMKLQSDPTTIYGLKERFDGNLKKKDLQELNEYNTYMISGLPKGPICNPGIAAIKAVLFPAEHKYLFFVSSNDGRHIFSESYDQHRHWVNLYQRKK